MGIRFGLWSAGAGDVAGATRRCAFLCAAALALAVAPASAQVLPSATAVRFQRLHQPDSPFAGPLGMDGWYESPGAAGGITAAGPAPRARQNAPPGSVRAHLDEVYALLGPPIVAPTGVMPPGDSQPAVAGSGPPPKQRKDRAASMAERLALRGSTRVARIVLPPGFAAVDLHVHTRFSPDSTAEPEAMVRAAAERGLAGMAITDHNTVAGAEYARAVAARLRALGELPSSFFVIEGEEVGSRDGHIVGLFLRATVPPGMTAAATIAAIHAQGGLAVAAHPSLRSGVGELAASLPFDAVETENVAEDLHFSLGSASANGRRAAFYRTITQARVGSSDAHDPTVVGLGYTVVPAALLDEGRLRQALAARETRVGLLSPARHWRRVAESTARPAGVALREYQRLLAPGQRALRELTGADQASLGPRVSHGRLMWALRVTKRL